MPSVFPSLSLPLSLVLWPVYLRFFFFPRRMRTGHRKAILRFVRGPHSGISYISNAATTRLLRNARVQSLTAAIYVYVRVRSYACGRLYVWACVYILHWRDSRGRTRCRGERMSRVETEIWPLCGRGGTSRNGDRTRSPRSLPFTVGFSRVLGGPRHRDRELILDTAGRERYGMMMWDPWPVPVKFSRFGWDRRHAPWEDSHQSISWSCCGH